MPARRGFFAMLIALATTSAFGGCADPQARLEAFNERCEGSEACQFVETDSGAACDPPEPGALAGEFYFVLGALAAELPIVFLADVETGAGENGGTTLQMRLQPLAAVDRKTPVCGPVDLPPIQISAEGQVEAPLPLLRVPGRANPISGRDIAAEPTLIASFCGVQDSYCGAVSGFLREPFDYDLTGSSFTMYRADEPLPEPLVVSCDGKIANPPPDPLDTYPECP
jgi:hypothetical protein